MNSNAKKIILITGGTQGIGFALARRLVSDGHKVVVTGRNPEHLQVALEECDGLQGIISDVTKKNERQYLINYIKREYGALDVLVNNAGIGKGYVFADKGSEKLFENEVNTNLIAPALLINELFPLISKSGIIVNVTSGFALWPAPCVPGYSASKAGLSAFTSVLREQLKVLKKDISVVEVCPPVVDTGMTKDMSCFKVTTEDVAEKIAWAIYNRPERLLIGVCVALEILRRISPGLVRLIIRRWPIEISRLLEGRR